MAVNARIFATESNIDAQGGPLLAALSTDAPPFDSLRNYVLITVC